MWNILTVSTPNAGSYILMGGQSGKEVLNPTDALGPQGSVYVLAFPGIGYMKLTDTGNTVPGGDWSVQVSGSSKHWFYGGGGQAYISINSSGGYTISGGSNTITGQL
ncbi:hypothetical protein BXZ70DRAFT_1005624 [Cristinia sonorae]|uniref:Uncharacterized protein n=1 Tax=Cristinia sonorae TaxID=1940300 RepID=A0A8K0UVE0_9AGAR|nr:hypothetical protein BXZ70DRAFT_1005624 [Cristinia sonorae]